MYEDILSRCPHKTMGLRVILQTFSTQSKVKKTDTLLVNNQPFLDSHPAWMMLCIVSHSQIQSPFVFM